MRQTISRHDPRSAEPGILGLAAAAPALLFVASTAVAAAGYPVVDTGQSSCYDAGSRIICPDEGASFYGQDAQHSGRAPSYTDNGDGTITDNVTGLIWQRSPGDKQGYGEAIAGADSFSLAGHDDWRVPSIKELYSLIDFRGVDPSGFDGSDTSGLIPFIDTDYFDFAYGDTSAGQRVIDSQWVTSTVYQSTVMGGQECFFGVNFADGRIKCYPTQGGSSGYYAIYVRGSSYGDNSFVDNGDGTITDNATGLMWSEGDSGAGLDWEEALAWVEQMNASGYLGHDDWRLPNVKELQSIVDYGRSPDTTGSAAIDPLFITTAIGNETGRTDYPSYWSGTTHVNWTEDAGGAGAYVAFGRAMGYMDGGWIDVHGAGAQRSDPKAGDPADWPTGNGPQGDAIRIYNFVRLVRTAGGSVATTGDSVSGCAELGGEAVAGNSLSLEQTRESTLRGRTGEDGCFTLGPVVSGKPLKVRLRGIEGGSGQDDLAVCFMLAESVLARNGQLLLKRDGKTVRSRWTDGAGCRVLQDLAGGATFNLVLKVESP